MEKIERLLESDAFSVIDKERREEFLKLFAQLKGKSQPEAMSIIYEFSKKQPQGKQLTKEEQQLMMNAMLESMEEGERKKFLGLLEMLKLKANFS